MLNQFPFYALVPIIQSRKIENRFRKKNVTNIYLQL